MIRFIVYIVCLIVLGGCYNAHDSAAVPRPRAYPRVETYPMQYRDLTVGPLKLKVNSSAESIVDGLWADVNYSAYEMAIYITVTQINDADLEAVMNNRTERMALNLGGAQGELTQFMTDNGAWAVMVTSRSGSGLTPIQFLATDSTEWVVSGVVTSVGAANADSIKPTIDAIKNDVLELLMRL